MKDVTPSDLTPIRELKTKTVYAPGFPFRVKGTLASGAKGSIHGSAANGFLVDQKERLTLLSPEELAREKELEAKANGESEENPEE